MKNKHTALVCILLAKHNLPLWWVAYLKNHYPKH